MIFMLIFMLNFTKYGRKRSEGKYLEKMCKLNKDFRKVRLGPNCGTIYLRL